MITKGFMLIVVLSWILHDDLGEKIAYFLAQGIDEKDGVNDLFQDLSDSQIRRLGLESHPQIAIYARWILAKREAKSFDSVEHQRISYVKFSGFLSGKFDVNVPSWWLDHLLSPKPAIAFESYPEFREIRDVQVDSVRCRNSLEISNLDPDYINLFQDEKEVKFIGSKLAFLSDVENGVFFEKGISVDCIACDLAKDGQSVLAVLTLSGVPTLYCVDKSGRGLWTAEVRKFRHRNGTWKFAPRGLVDVACVGDRVSVFWRNELEVTFDVFDLYTGSNLISFSTGSE